MKTQNNSLLNTLSKAEKTQLTTITSETLATTVKQTHAFTAADLWNIQRQKRSFVQRRFNAA
ncbi:MAG: hypothetical protein EOO03_01690 [Chitinophagaceae bacterium]|nr:MAG: hypothetical protein EOO03_01690 [Chitinophagaceae bacterium]